MENRPDSERDPRVRLAAERTLLAWIRTGLAMMGFGFVVARFGLFLRELAAIEKGTARGSGLSLWLGTALIVLGVVVNLLAALEYWRFLRRYERGEANRLPRWSLGLTSAVLLAAIGVGMIGYLVTL
jgi:putative membrane protein